jgi:hypothetical protein
MSIAEYLESEELTDLVRYHSEAPQNAIAFVGTLRKHPYDGAKCLLIGDPAGCDPVIYEFRISDILGAEELPSPVDVSGQPRPRQRLWVKRGSFGLRYEPFEVDDPPRFPRDSGRLRDRILKSATCWS